MIASPADALSSEHITEAVTWRRHLHRHPELAFNERQTADFVASQLARFGLTIHRGLAGTGVVGTVSRGTSRRTIGIRADMDALPIAERSGAEHASSVAGVMHACGHDGHVAIALAAARACARLTDLDGTVHFIFQPAEEGAGGAARMMEEGLFKQFPCDSIYALHNWPALPVGSCVARDGAMMAATAMLDIQIEGVGGHGAIPHETIDPINAACHMVSAMHSIVSRNVDPLQAAVISATQISAGHTFNVIPATCSIGGTTRWFDENVGQVLERRVNEVCRSVATAFGCEAKVGYHRRFPPTINNPAAARLIRDIAATSAVGLNVVDANPSMASEDFSFMLQALPGCYLWLGTGSEHNLHSPHFDFNDAALPFGAALWVELVRRSLSAA